MGTPEVAAWLGSIYKRDAELAGYVRFVEENEIDGYVLLDLIEQGQIGELGITKPLHQSKLRANAKKLQLAANSAPPGNVAPQSETTPDMSRSPQLAADTEAPARGRRPAALAGPLVQRLQFAARETVDHGAVSLEPTWEAEAPLERDQGKLFGQSGTGTNGGRQAGWDTQRRQPRSASDGGAATSDRVAGRNDAMLDGWFDREPDLHRSDLQTGWCDPTCDNARKALLDVLWSMDPDRLAEAIDCFAGIKWRDVRNKTAYVANTLHKNFGADWNSAGASRQPMPQRAQKRPADGGCDGSRKRHKDAGDAPRGGNAVAHIAMQSSHAIVTFYDSAFPAKFLGDRREVKVDDTSIDGLKIRRDRGCADSGALFCGWKPGC
jgi:hypothetical protein